MAIVVAAIIIGGAIFFGYRGSKELATGDSGTGAPAAVAVSLREVAHNEHIRGNPDAPFKLVEYSDLECPFCKSFHATMQKAMDEYGKTGTLAWVYRHFPLDSIHPKADKEAEGAECAAEQGGNAAFWSFVDRIFEITPSNNGLDSSKLTETAAYLKLDVKKFDACLASGRFAEAVERDYQDGLSAGARGTPFNVLVLKNKVTKAQEEKLAALLAQLRGGIAISSDKQKVTLNGALPYGALKTILDALQ